MAPCDDTRMCTRECCVFVEFIIIDWSSSNFGYVNARQRPFWRIKEAANEYGSGWIWNTNSTNDVWSHRMTLFIIQHQNHWILDSLLQPSSLSSFSFLAPGTIGFFSSFWFVNKIYSMDKVDGWGGQVSSQPQAPSASASQEEFMWKDSKENCLSL